MRRILAAITSRFLFSDARWKKFVVKNSTRQNFSLQPRIRIWRGDDIALGPGKAELLEHLQATGSISLAAESMGVSYMRAWNLIQTMNKCFKEPLVVSLRGGKQKGGAMLTPIGEKVLTLYKEMEAASLSANKASWDSFKKLLRA